MSAVPDLPVIIRGEPADLDRIGPLWQSLQAHHLAVSTVDLPARDPDASWAARRALYERWFASGDAELWLLQRGAGIDGEGGDGGNDTSRGDSAGDVVGYAMVRIGGQSMTYAVDRLATLETLVVARELRGTGAGSRLITAAFDDLRARDFDGVEVTHMEGNEGAGRLYAAHGFQPFARMLIAPLD